MCREIVKIARVLATKRDMGLNELKLTIAVEDPRVKERRSMGIEVQQSINPLITSQFPVLASHVSSLDRPHCCTVSFPPRNFLAGLLCLKHSWRVYAWSVI